MALTPMVPSSGLAGWTILQSTLGRQTEVFNRSADIKADVDYLHENLKDGMSVGDFIGDARLQRITLTAYGLAEETGKSAFVRKILSEGTQDSRAFAVRLNNTQYLNLAKALDFTDGTLNLGASKNVIARKYQDEMFEAALDNVDGSLRLALNFKREIGDIAGRTDLSEKAGWFKLMGSPPLRAVMESAMNLPPAISQLDVDRQADIMAEKAETLFGSRSLNALSDPEMVETVIRRFMLNDQINSGPSAFTPGYAALALLGGGIGIQSIASLISSF